jgi:ornithine--oxo-acid transaminase
MAYDIADLFAQRERERFAMHSRHFNEQMVRVLKAIGYDVGFCRGEGQYLYDREGTRYLDLLSGFGVFARAESPCLAQSAEKCPRQ